MSDVYDDDVAPARVRDVQCDGGEGRLVDCPHQSIGGSDTCAAYMRAAGVVCGGKAMNE